jgi:myosin heavy subunit
MDSLGFTVEEKHSIFCIVSGIIQLGNISFSAALIKGSDGGAPPSHYS